jgi:hypothetical protein
MIPLPLKCIALVILSVFMWESKVNVWTLQSVHNQLQSRLGLDSSVDEMRIEQAWFSIMYLEITRWVCLAYSDECYTKLY